MATVASERFVRTPFAVEHSLRIRAGRSFAPSIPSRDTAMFEFFRGWKRKIGCVCFIVTILLSLCWIYSFINPSDSISAHPDFLSSLTMTQVVSKEGKLGLGITTLKTDPDPGYRAWNAGFMDVNVGAGPFRFRCEQSNSGHIGMGEIWLTFPYFMIVLPVMWLSIWLLLPPSSFNSKISVPGANKAITILAFFKPLRRKCGLLTLMLAGGSAVVLMILKRAEEEQAIFDRRESHAPQINLAFALTVTLLLLSIYLFISKPKSIKEPPG